jgi:hypothetical protein
MENFKNNNPFYSVFMTLSMCVSITTSILVLLNQKTLYLQNNVLRGEISHQEMMLESLRGKIDSLEHEYKKVHPKTLSKKTFSSK